MTNATAEQDKTAPPPTIEKVSVTINWDAPQNPEFPVKSYYVSVHDNGGNVTNYPVDKSQTSYTLDVDVDQDNPSYAIVGVSYVIGPPAVSEKRVGFNVEPNN